VGRGGGAAGGDDQGARLAAVGGREHDDQGWVALVLGQVKQQWVLAVGDVYQAGP
jgi:hypothetical protein